MWLSSNELGWSSDVYLCLLPQRRCHEFICHILSLGNTSVKIYPFLLWNLSSVLLGCTIALSLVAQMVKNPPAMKETWVQSLGWDDPLEMKMVTHSSILTWEIHGQRSLAGYNPWSLKELDMTEWLTLLLWSPWTSSLTLYASIDFC